LVVDLALLGIGQDLVRTGDLLELLGVAALVGVVLDGRLAVRLLDLRRVRGLGDAEDVIKLGVVALRDGRRRRASERERSARVGRGLAGETRRPATTAATGTGMRRECFFSSRLVV